MNRMLTTAPSRDSQPLAIAPAPVRRRWGLLLVVGLLAVAAVLIGAQTGRDRAETELMAQTGIMAGYRAALLRTEIERYRSLPAVLSQDPDIRDVLRTGDPARIGKLDSKLRLIAHETAVSVIYVLDVKGKGISMSAMLDDGTKFCKGANYCAERFYFTEAVRAGSAQLYALGRSNQRAGLYFSHAIHDTDGALLGVVVAKVEFASIQRRWRAQGGPTFMTDEHGMVLASSVPAWLGRSLEPLDPGLRRKLIDSLQFGALPLDPMPVRGLGQAVHAPILTRIDSGRGLQAFVAAGVPLDTPGWRLFLLAPSEPRLSQAALGGGAIALLATVLVLTLAAVLLHRHERRQAELRQQIAMREELEGRVAERTRALRTANASLLTEIENRQRMEGDVHRLQDELVQANKLGALGQIAAGVAHEVNQPLAAIRTYAASARKFMLRGRQAEAENNLAIIDDLTGRIKLITDELRAFARRTPREIGLVSIDDAISGALLLVNHRLAQESVELVRQTRQSALKVMAERIRLEQVLLNLLQNALDALDGRQGARIELKVEASPDKVRITVADNGPGLSKEARAALFMPFSTTKAQGLGLGLVISREIVDEMGGELALDATKRGASFTVTLNRAPPKLSERGAAGARSLQESVVD